MSEKNRIILHVDMDSFFASVEANRRNIEGEPVVVCVYSGRTEDSGAVSTANYSAREYGIEAGIPIKVAKRIAEEYHQELGVNFHFIPVDKEYYRNISGEIKDRVLDDYTGQIERASVDEFFLDLTKEAGDFKEARKIGEEIRTRVKEEFNLTCSVGISSNKLVAKIASDQDKPDGLTLVMPEGISDFMFSLELSDVHGIGDKTIERLSSIGIESVRDLANSEEVALVREFGEKLGPKLRRRARGVDQSEVEERKQKQISRITTLKENNGRFDYIDPYLKELADDLMERLLKEQLSFRRVVLITIDTELKMRTRSTTLTSYSVDKEVIISEASRLLEDFLGDFDGEIRRIGLRVSDLQGSQKQKKISDY